MNIEIVNGQVAGLAERLAGGPIVDLFLIGPRGGRYGNALMTPDQAREIARQLVEAADRAELLSPQGK